VPNFIHKPVMLTEVLAALRPRPDSLFVDGTIGGGGHAATILAASSPTGRLFGCDRDGAAIEAATCRLAEYAGRFELRRGNFAELADWLAPGSADAVLLDLGVSSHQLDEAARGFSFQRDARLDMRMDDRQPLTASDLINTWSEAALAKIFWELGDEPQGRRFARAIVTERQQHRMETTGQLAALIERAAAHRGKVHPATRVFMAIRMALNDEIRSLQSGLAAACTVLKAGGRLAVITFCSTEDRVVKAFGREQTRDYEFDGEVDVPELRRPRAPSLRWVSRKAIQPADNEVADNPRARSAQLRVLEKL
jgi:16S rRNA (cytosine1402-N4)-methyltransferase